jgi:hypothetical protein
VTRLTTRPFTTYPISGTLRAKHSHAALSPTYTAPDPPPHSLHTFRARQLDIALNHKSTATLRPTLKKPRGSLERLKKTIGRLPRSVLFRLQLQRTTDKFPAT